MALTIPEIKNALRESLEQRKAFYFNCGRGSSKNTMLARTFEDVLNELAKERKYANTQRKN